MASTQFLDLTNNLLRRLNEVQITQANFPATQGVQKMASDAIDASVQLINQQQWEWPFNAANSTQLLTIGQVEYSFPSDYKTADWNSFYIQYSASLAVNATHLGFITTDYYKENYKTDDMDRVATGRNLPEAVFKSHTGGFGVTPSPDKAYTVQFDYWKLQPRLVAYGDLTTIPSSFDETIIQNALYHFYMFRDNLDAAKEAEGLGRNMISQMRSLLINSDETVNSTMLVQNTNTVQMGAYGTTY